MEEIKLPDAAAALGLLRRGLSASLLLRRMGVEGREGVGVRTE